MSRTVNWNIHAKLPDQVTKLESEPIELVFLFVTAQAVVRKAALN